MRVERAWCKRKSWWSAVWCGWRWLVRASQHAMAAPTLYNVLEALDRELVHPDQWEAVPGRGLLKLVSGNLASLKQTQDFLGCLLDFGLKGPHPLLDGGCGPCFWGRRP